MKKGIFINLTIITLLVFGSLISKLNDQYSIISTVVLFACLIAAIRLSRILIPFETRFTHKQRVKLIVLIIANYVAILGRGSVSILELSIENYLAAVVLILYIVFITVYLESGIIAERSGEN